MEVTFGDGTEPLLMIFEAPKGFEADQKQRKGIVELLHGKSQKAMHFSAWMS